MRVMKGELQWQERQKGKGKEFKRENVRVTEGTFFNVNPQTGFIFHKNQSNTTQGEAQIN